MTLLKETDKNAHRRQEDYCNECAGDCQYDDEGYFINADAIRIDCPECGEATYPEAYNTPDQDEFSRICNGCGKWWTITERQSLATETTWETKPKVVYCDCFWADVPLTLVDGKCSQCDKPPRH